MDIVDYVRLFISEEFIAENGCGIVEVGPIPEELSQGHSVSHLIKVKECFANALKIASIMPGRINYVEGYVLTEMGIPVEHAWNELDGKHFDVTNQILFSGKAYKEYFMIGKLSKIKDMIRIVNKPWTLFVDIQKKSRTE